jgi:hypothetical protein
LAISVPQGSSADSAQKSLATKTWRIRSHSTKRNPSSTPARDGKARHRPSSQKAGGGNSQPPAKCLVESRRSVCRQDVQLLLLQLRTTFAGVVIENAAIITMCSAVIHFANAKDASPGVSTDDAFASFSGASGDGKKEAVKACREELDFTLSARALIILMN